MKKYFIILVSIPFILYAAYVGSGFLYAKTISTAKAKRLAVVYGLCNKDLEIQENGEEFTACVERAKNYLAHREINFMVEEKFPFLGPVLTQPKF